MQIDENTPIPENTEFPVWVQKDSIHDMCDIEAICHGGCASGAYMPAVTYYQARETMSEHGDDVLQFIEDYLGELPQPPKGESWSGMSCFFLSCAVEMWAHHVYCVHEEEAS